MTTSFLIHHWPKLLVSLIVTILLFFYADIWVLAIIPAKVISLVFNIDNVPLLIETDYRVLLLILVFEVIFLVLSYAIVTIFVFAFFASFTKTRDKKANTK